MTTQTRIKEEGVVTILDSKGRLLGIIWKDIENKGETKIFKTEVVSYGEMKDFMETIVDVPEPIKSHG